MKRKPITAAKLTALDKLKWYVVVRVFCEDRLEERENLEKIDVKISWLAIWLNLATFLAHRLGSPADQSNLDNKI